MRWMPPKSASRWNINSFYITRKNAVPFAGKTIRTGIWQTRKQAPTRPLLSATLRIFQPSRLEGAGVAVPVFSSSEKSFGVGDFGDLKRMIDWAVSTKQKAVQILPINDTTMTHTWTDSYPYNSISIYAFHPMYTDLKQLGTLKDKSHGRLQQTAERAECPAAVDYEAVNKTKWEYFHLIFKQEGEKVLSSAAFHDFLNQTKVAATGTPFSVTCAMFIKRPTSASGLNTAATMPQRLRSSANRNQPIIRI